MAHQYKEPTYVGSSVVLDSSGVGGIFWAPQDAVDAAANAGWGHVFVMSGTYGPFDLLSNTHNSIHVECDSPRSGAGSSGGPTVAGDWGVMFTGGQANDNALDMTASAEVSWCGFWTSPGGAGGGFAAVNISSGNQASFQHNYVMGSDAAAIIFNPNTSNCSFNYVNHSYVDGTGIHLNSSGADGSVVHGNIAHTGGITIDAGANYNAITGNATNTGISDSGTGNSVTGNSQF
jgi:hypothetical protein